MRGKRIQRHGMQPVGARPGSPGILNGLDAGILGGNVAELLQSPAETAPMSTALTPKIDGLVPCCGQLRIESKQIGKPVNDTTEEQSGSGLAGSAAICGCPSLEKPCLFEPCRVRAQPCLGESKHLCQFGRSSINAWLSVGLYPICRPGHGSQPGPRMGRCPANAEMRGDPLHKVNESVALPSKW